MQNNIFLDFEFIEDGNKQLLAPISLGMVKQTGETFYKQFADAPFNEANLFVQDNVLPHLEAFDIEYNLAPSGMKPESNTVSVRPQFTLHTSDIWIHRSEARDLILEFVGMDTPTFIGYYADYDWVLFCQLLGTMSDLPHRWPMHCFDIKQYADMVEEQHNIPRLMQPSRMEHHALTDAEWNKVLYTYYDTIDSLFHPRQQENATFFQNVFGAQGPIPQ